MKTPDGSGNLSAETTLFPEFDASGTDGEALFRAPDPVEVRFEASPAELTGIFPEAEETGTPPETGADARLLAERAEQISSKLENAADTQSLREIRETAGRMEQILEEIRELMSVFEKEFWT